MRNKNVTDTKEEIYCPACNKKMVKHKASPNCSVEIDDCYSCGGKFLDYQELDKIRAAKPTTEEQIDSIVEALYLKNGYTSYNAKESSVRTFLSHIYKQFGR